MQTLVLKSFIICVLLENLVLSVLLLRKQRDQNPYFWEEELATSNNFFSPVSLCSLKYDFNIIKKPKITAKKYPCIQNWVWARESVFHTSQVSFHNEPLICLSRSCQDAERWSFSCQKILSLQFKVRKIENFKLKVTDSLRG